jgi:hypothetical protein
MAHSYQAPRSKTAPPDSLRSRYAGGAAPATAATPFHALSVGPRPQTRMGPRIPSGVDAPGPSRGLPPALRMGVERLSGVAMDDVKVNLNSHKPIRLNAHACAEADQIDVAPGQEGQLPHEAWHAAQQKQGRAPVTRQFKSLKINDDASLEREADVMGARAMASTGPAPTGLRRVPLTAGPVQGVFVTAAGGFWRGAGPKGEMVRAPWTGKWKTAHVPAGKERNHVIAYNPIMESLTNLLNGLYSARGTAGEASAQQALIDLTESLYIKSTAEHAQMAKDRDALILLITKIGVTPSAAEINGMRTYADSLESHLMSAPENVRVGDSSLNHSIGDNIDADYRQAHVALPAYKPHGSNSFLGGIPTPTAWTNSSGAKWGQVESGGALKPGDEFFCMTDSHNQIVWNFMTKATPYMAKNLTVVRNNDAKNLLASHAVGAPLSSTVHAAGQVSAKATSPVLIFDPLGADLPRRFG